MAIQNGSNLILKVQQANGAADEFKLMHSQNCSISINADTIDISNKDSAGFRDLIGGQKSFSLSADGLMDFNPSSPTTITEVDELFTQMMARTSVTFTFTLASTSTGDYTYTGNGFITSLEISGGTEDAPTYSITIEGNSTLTQNTI
tara:strand:- start:381 stop:821 length:441 start_codon:yes stop_codon:yes gene_type:complete